MVDFVPALPQCLRTVICPGYSYTLLQSQKAVSAYFTSKQIPLFGFADQFIVTCCCCGAGESAKHVSWHKTGPPSLKGGICLLEKWADTALLTLRTAENLSWINTNILC